MLCFISFWGHKRIQKVKKGQKRSFFYSLKIIEKKWSDYFFKGKTSIRITFSIKKKRKVWTYFFKYKKIWLNFGNCPIMKKVGWLGQFRWQIWVSHQISYMKWNLIYNFVKFSKKKYLATKWSWYLGLYHIYIFIYTRWICIIHI